MEWGERDTSVGHQRVKFPGEHMFKYTALITQMNFKKIYFDNERNKSLAMSGELQSTVSLCQGSSFFYWVNSLTCVIKGSACVADTAA